MEIVNEIKPKDDSEKPKFVHRTLAEVQRAKLEKLMKNPVSFIYRLFIANRFMFLSTFQTNLKETKKFNNVQTIFSPSGKASHYPRKHQKRQRIQCTIIRSKCNGIFGWSWFWRVSCLPTLKKKGICATKALEDAGKIAAKLIAA